MTTPSLFAPASGTASQPIIASDCLSIEARVSHVVANLKRLLTEGYHFNIATSFGKDSAVSLSLCLQAMLELKAEGTAIPECVVVTSNTGIENPEIDRYSRRESAKVRQFAQENDLPLTVSIVMPSLSNNYLVQILSGRTIASLPDGNGKCSQMMKVEPINRHKRLVLGKFGNDRVVTIIGKRLDESAHRKADMISRGESAIDPIRNDNGEYILSPIMHFDIDAVYEYIGYVKAGLLPQTYTDYDDMLRVYRSSNGGACELAVHATGKSNSEGCGARHGCHLCCRVQNDSSMENMLAEEEFAYMKPLNQFRAVLLANHYDPYKRNWIARTINDDGTITISPVAYSPEYCIELIKYALTIDAEEIEAAEALGISPRFQLLSEMEILAIDYQLNRYGYARAFVACRLYRDIFHNGARYPMPEKPEVFPKRGFPEPVDVPFADEEYNDPFSGLRDLESGVADCEHVINKGGVLYSGGSGGDFFSVDEEAAALFFDFELDYALDKFNGSVVAPTAVVHYLHRMGIVQIYRGSHSQVDKMLRVANQVHRKGLRPILHDREALVFALSGEAAAGQMTLFNAC